MIYSYILGYRSTYMPSDAYFSVQYDNLYHHGVKGQKWGVVKSEDKGTSLTPSKPAQKEDRLNNSVSNKSERKQTISDVQESMNQVTEMMNKLNKEGSDSGIDISDVQAKLKEVNEMLKKLNGQ